MKRRMVALALVVGACQPQPRSVSFFEAHPEERSQILADCAHGNRRGAECDNARVADGAIRAKAREALFRKGFE
jgi:hypothetical protein